MMGAVTEPENLVERAASAGMDAIRERLSESGSDIKKLIILLQITDAPDGEADEVTAGSNVGDERELIATLAEHLVMAAGEIGIHVDILPVAIKGQG